MSDGKASFCVLFILCDDLRWDCLDERGGRVFDFSQLADKPLGSGKDIDRPIPKNRRPDP